MQTKETCNYKQGERKIIIETERQISKKDRERHEDKNYQRDRPIKTN